MVVWKAFQLERSKEDRLYQQSDMLNVYLARTKHVKHQIDTDSDSKRYWVVLSVFRMWLRLMSCAHTYSNNSRVTMNSFQIHLCVRIDDSDWSSTLFISLLTRRNYPNAVLAAAALLPREGPSTRTLLSTPLSIGSFTCYIYEAKRPWRDRCQGTVILKILTGMQKTAYINIH